MPHSLKLDLADGRRWIIRPVDEQAAAIVAELGRVMRLVPGAGGRELCVSVGNETERPVHEADGAGACRLVAPTDRETQVDQMRRIASLIARESMVRGGLLFHGALAEYRGSGFIMAGPGMVGKSTASRRLPLPWRSLSDDMTLVVRDGKGRLWAHPWPTWSSLRPGRPGGSWAVEHAVPLRAVFFLDQAPSDQLEPLNVTQATALTLESAEELVHEVKFVLTDVDAARVLSNQVLSVAKSLALSIPGFSLRLSLDGRFWERIERVLPVGALLGSGEDGGCPDPVSVESLMAGDSLRVVCTGNSMEPTFRDSDLLEIRPYGTRRVRPGDVVCFNSPDKGTTVVHRVVAVDSGGIRTRGDNNSTDDPRVLPAGDVIGRTEAAQRGPRRWVVRGGWRGRLELRCARLVRGIRRYAGPLPHRLYSLVAGLGPFDHLLPVSYRPRLVRFGTPYQVFLKLLMGRHTVGQCDRYFEKWQIRRPFRLFVDERIIRKAVFLAMRSKVRD